MKKMTLKMWLLGGFVAIASLCATSCAEGADCDERFDAGVNNAQLESPVIDLSCFESIANADGSETVKFTWPVVMGAGGYEVKVANVNDPANPVYLVDTLIDGQTVTFAKTEDTSYDVAVRTLGNEKRNNKEASAASVYAYSTWAPMIDVPAGAELSAFVAANIIEPEDADLGQGFRLAAGAEYTIEAPVDFNLYNMTLLGDANNRPIVKVKGDGCLMTQAGLKVKYISFDCTEMTELGLITMHSTPDESISTTTLGFKEDGANQDAYHVKKPIILNGCWVKNLPHGIIYDNQQPYAIWDLRIQDCLVQLCNTGGNAILNLYKKGKSIKDMLIENCTMYNTSHNNSAYFIRYNNASNSQPKKVYGDANAKSTHKWYNNTFAKTFSGKDFGNNTTQQNVFFIYMENNNFYDVFRLYQYLHNNTKRYTTNNALCYKDGSPQSNDYGGRTDSDGKPYTTLEETPFFNEPEGGFPALDLTQPNGGVNFKATGALSSTIGDPRWL